MKACIKLAGIAIIVAAMLFSSCANYTDGILNEYFNGGDYSRNLESRTYYNGFSGIQVTLLKDFYVLMFDDVNLTDNPESSMYFDDLYIYDYGDGGYSIDLAILESQNDSSHEDHCEIDIYLEGYEYLPKDEYLEMFYSYIMESDDPDYVRSNIFAGSAVLNGNTYEKFVVEVTNYSYDESFIEEYYILPLDVSVQGIYLVAYINYWADSAKSQEDAYYLLNNAYNVGTPTGSDGSSIQII